MVVGENHAGEAPPHFRTTEDAKPSPGFGVSGGGTSGGSPGGNSEPNTSKLLLVLMGVVPLVVLVAVAVAYLLIRAGFGLLVGAGVPFVAATIFIVGLSVALGRATGGSSGSGGSSDDRSDGSGGRPRKRDGV